MLQKVSSVIDKYSIHGGLVFVHTRKFSLCFVVDIFLLNLYFVGVDNFTILLPFNFCKKINVLA